MAAIAAVGIIGVIGCGGGGGQTDRPNFERSDSAAIDLSWPTRLRVYAASHLSEPDVARRLGFQGATRTRIDTTLERYRYETDAATLEVFFDDGLEQPFHSVTYTRREAFVPLAWGTSAELRQQWQDAAATGAAIIRRITDLTPVVFVGMGTDDDYASTLQDGFNFGLLVDGRVLFIDDLRVQVDGAGVYSFHTDEMPLGAAPSGDVECRSRQEIDSILTQNGLGTTPATPAAIFYGFVNQQAKLLPFYLAATAEGAPAALWMDRATDPMARF